MNSRDLEYIVAVAKFKHFGKAAEHCSVSQPSLSFQVRKLEADLNVQIFERTNRTVKVTLAGEQIVTHAKSILELVERMENSAKLLADPFFGQFRIGMIPTIGPYLTPLLLPAISRLLPKLKLSLSEETTDLLEKSLLNGDIDAAILATPVVDPRLLQIALYDEPFWVAVPNQHPNADLESIDINELRTDEMLLLEDGHCFRDQVLSFCEKALTKQPKFKTFNTSLTTILALVGSGSGVTLVPAMSLSSSWVTDSGIVLRPEKSGTAARAVVLAYRKSYPNRLILERFADIVCSVVPDTVYPVRR